MKIRSIPASYDAVLSHPRPAHKPPRRPSILFRTLMRLLGAADLRDAQFSYTIELERAGEGPYLILMNHSAFIDLEIVSRVFYPMPYCIVCTSDGFVGKEWLMRSLGCIPTQKFVTDITLIRDMQTALHEKKTSVLMYPEASYSFDGCETPLPRRLGLLLKRLGVPVIMVRTYGAFARDPLYNCLQKRHVPVRAEITCLASREEIAEKSTEELDALLENAFTFDSFAWQKENHVEITEPFRADGLHRILFRCPHCSSESGMHGEGTRLRCASCGKEWEMDTLGQLSAVSGETEFAHIPDWYRWERQLVRESITRGTYHMECDVTIRMMVDYKAVYEIGEGHLTHTSEGFTLDGADGKLHYTQPPLSSYGLYADYYWYEIGDMICIGNRDALYYCFPKEEIPVAKARMAAEELYRSLRAR